MICLRDGLRQDILVTTSHLRIIQYHRMSKEISLFIRSSPHRNPLQLSSLAPLLAPVRLSPPSEGPIFICLRADLRQDILVVTSHLGIIQQHRSCPLLAPVRLSPPSEGPWQNLNPKLLLHIMLYRLAKAHHVGTRSPTKVDQYQCLLRIDACRA